MLHPAPTQLHELIKAIKDDTKTTADDNLPNLIYAPPGDQQQRAPESAATTVAASV